jgi:DNA-binding winged helix-turn-helix (wHTH) protein
VLDLDAFRLERSGVPVALEPKALSLLALMVRRPNHLFTKQEIFGAVWPDTAVTDHALTRIVAQIRRALGDEAREARYLETVPTRGYRWIRPVVEVAFESPTPDVVFIVTLRRDCRRSWRRPWGDGGRAWRAGLATDRRFRP